MLDQATPKGRILAAALACAAQKSWAEVALLDIAEAANLSLADLRGAFASKTDIIAALLRAVDDEVLKKTPKRSEGQEKRDVLFDIVMTRFDVLAPHKAALKSMYASGPADFALAGPYLSSQHWMLRGRGHRHRRRHGRPARGGPRPRPTPRCSGSGSRTTTPGLARTMAALDRRLRRGERALGGIEGVASALNRFATDAPGFLRSVVRGRAKPEPSPGPEARHACKNLALRQSHERTNRSAAASRSTISSRSTSASAPSSPPSRWRAQGSRPSSSRSTSGPRSAARRARRRSPGTMRRRR